MKILIVGGGIGGLSLSAYLRKQGHEVVLIERSRTWRTIGYVLGLFPSGLRVLKEIGVADKLQALSKVLPSHVLKDHKGRTIRESSFERIHKKHGPVLETEREILHTLLREANDGADIRMGTTVTNIEQDEDGVNVTFNDDVRERFDLVVGADGINSQIRKYVQPKTNKQYTGLTFWLMWVTGVTPPKEVIYFLGDAKVAAVFPCNNDHLAVMFGLPAKAHSYTDPLTFRAFLVDHFSDMPEPVATILKHLPEGPAEIYHNDDEEVHLKTWHSGRVVLLGDAIHALSPMLGMGASMALEDSRVLAEELGRCDGDVSGAFNAYRRRRLPRVRHLARWSWLLHRLTNMGGRLSRVRNSLMKHVLARVYFWNLESFMNQKV